MDKVLISICLVIFFTLVKASPEEESSRYYETLKLIEEERLLDLEKTSKRLQEISSNIDQFSVAEQDLYNLLLAHSLLMRSEIEKSKRMLVKLTKESKSVDIKARAYSILTSLHLLIGNNVESFIALDRALNHLPRVKNQTYKLDILVNSVSVYKETEMLEFALEHARRLLSIANQQKSDLTLCNGMFELGDIENIAGKRSIAKNRLALARTHCEKSDERLAIIMIDESLARIDLYEGYYDSALKVLERSYSDTKDYGWGVMIALYQIRIGESYYKLKDLDQALEYAKSAYKIAKNIKDEKRIELSASLLAKLYSDLGNKDKAIQYFKEYMEKNKENDAKVRQRKLAFDVARRGKI